MRYAKVSVWVFRGFTAAASLKEAMAKEIESMLKEVFRGFTAAASLKAGTERRENLSSRQIVFRGFTAAASLKVPIQRNDLGLASLEFSAVSPPRPH